MSQTQKIILGALAIAMSLGAAELASGHDFSGSLQALTGTGQTGVNRAAKADRAAALPLAAAPTRTISLRLEGLTDTSVLVRIPLRKEARETPAVRLLGKPGTGKPTVACEPVVSTLTDVARLLQPGRCVT